MNWEYLREEEFKDAVERCGGLCVIPLGCLEKHGQHCPVGTDSLKAMNITEEAAALEEVMVFPTGMWLGEVSGAHSNKDPIGTGCAGFIGLKQETILTILSELCDEIARNGFRKILILNSHGGNKAMLAHFLRRQTYEAKNYATMMTGVRDRLATEDPVGLYQYMQEHRAEYPMLTDSDMDVLKFWADKGTYGGGHADFTETVSVMGYYPDLIAMDRIEAESGLSTHRSDFYTDLGVNIVNAWGVNYPNNIHGFPAWGATQTIGQAMNTYCARRLAKIFKALKQDEDCVRIARKLPPVS